MSIWITLCNDVAVGIFGSVLSASFCNVLNTRRNHRIFWGFMLVITLMQGVIYSEWEGMFLRKIYPLVVHLPLVLVLYVLTRKFFWSLISALSAYLCCQLRRWIALFIVALSNGGEMMQDVVELIVTLPILLLLLRFVAPSIRQVMNHPAKYRIQFGIIPAIYYVFDYATVVYTDFLTSGSPVVVEFMPLVCCAGYLVFLLYYSSEEQKQSRLKQIQNSLDIQLKQSVHEISALRESQELAVRYRHDLRHHLQYVAACIENGQEEQAQAYISGICQEIEAQKVKRYCENETVNLIFSSFVGRAEREGVAMNICGTLPAFLLIGESDLCVLLSNALENAIHACQPLAADGESCIIDVQFYEKEGRFFLQITNPYTNPIRFEKGLPLSEREGHGIGVQSICAIVQRYGGIYNFYVKDKKFVLQLYF